MELPDNLPPEYEAARRSWEQHASWYRRTSAYLGIQVKLVICFMALLSLGLASTCWVYVVDSNARLREMMGQQAKQMAYALSLAGRPALSAGRTDELRHIGQDLLKAGNVVFIGFLDAQGRPLALASRAPDAQSEWSLAPTRPVQSLMQVRQRQSPLFGEYLEVVAPIVSAAPGNEPADASSTRLLGYATVGLWQSREQAKLQRINYLVVGIGCLIVIASLPLASLLVYRVFLPIRQLVAASNRIAAGDLEAQVAVHRPDLIGTLARSFNEMIKRVRQQQQDLAAANAKLEVANHDLERKVQQRTAELEAANVRLSREIAEKEDFLRAVSHDLNAPLRNIAGMASMLLLKYRQKFDEDIVHRLERIQKNVQLETDLIGELLELSRIKTRRQKMEAVEVTGLVHDLVELFESDLKGKHIQLSVDTPLPVLYGEPGRLRQVFQNLIDNAVKYMGEGVRDDADATEDRPLRKEIHIGCSLRSDAAEFYVSDTGMGIDPEDLDKVFHVFRRGKNSAAQNVAGKGVGLANVKSIIETYNGMISVESQVGRGSTFRFSIAGDYVPVLAQAQASLTDDPSQQTTMASAGHSDHASGPAPDVAEVRPAPRAPAVPRQEEVGS